MSNRNKHLIESNTSLTKTHSSKTDLILANNLNSFQKSDTTETGLRHFLKLISTFFKSHFSRQFIENLINTDFSLQSDDHDEDYSFLTKELSQIVEKHAPLKKKSNRGKHAPLMNKELRKAIYTRSK